MTIVTGASSQAISPQMILFNTGTASVPLSEVKIRYWFTVDGDKPQSYWCDYFYLSCGNITSQFIRLSAPRPGADYYLEIGFGTGTGSLAPGANTGPIQNRFSKSDWSAYTQTGDFSFDATKTQFVDWTKVTVYRNGNLVWGVEP
jgi:endoglucanase